MAATKTARERAAAAGDKDAGARLLAQLRAREPASKTVWLLADDDTQKAFDDARQREQIASFGADDAAKAKANADVAAARAALEESGAVPVVLCNAGRSEYRALVDRHPPTDDDHRAVQRDSGNAAAKSAFNLKTFPPALIELSSGWLTAQALAELVDKGQLSEGDQQVLFSTAHALYLNSRVADLGK